MTCLNTSLVNRVRGDQPPAIDSSDEVENTEEIHPLTEFYGHIPWSPAPPHRRG